MRLRTHRRRRSLAQLRWARWRAELQSELDWYHLHDDGDAGRGPSCGSCGCGVDPGDVECWFCGEDL